ncbi:MAG: hypothetical protein JNG84_09555 [Archangium sp.]|nr:hypothetical protein [Archangium sp.]
MASIATAVVVLAHVALAQVQPERPQPQRTAAQRIDFTDDLIEGGIERPVGDMYSVPQRPRFPTLLKVRTSFNDKLMQSVNEM